LKIIKNKYIKKSHKYDMYVSFSSPWEQGQWYNPLAGAENSSVAFNKCSGDSGRSCATNQSEHRSILANGNAAQAYSPASSQRFTRRPLALSPFSLSGSSDSARS
jgi:hypothetical protein